MIDARFVTIEAWPGTKRRAYERKKSPFDVKYSRLLDDLERELTHLRGKDIVIQAYFHREDIRNDGWPRSSARPSEPGVIVSFVKSNGQEVAFPCDTYQTYESNLRAISLTLTALRAVERYGVSQNDEQYKGWAKLPPAPKRMSAVDAEHFIVLHSGIQISSKASFDSSYRAAARKLHPDNQDTGNNDQFVLLQQAKTVLEETQGWNS